MFSITYRHLFVLLPLLFHLLILPQDYRSSAFGNTTRRVAVLPFENGGEEPGWDWFGETLAEEIRTAIRESAGQRIDLIPEARISGVLEGLPEPFRINPSTLGFVAEKLERPLILAGIYQIEEGTLILEGLLGFPHRDEIRRFGWVLASLESLPAVLHDFLRNALIELGGTVREEQPLYYQEPETGSPHAWARYYSARKFIREGNGPRALEELRALVQETPLLRQPRLLLARELVRGGTREEAILLLEGLTVETPELPERLILTEELDRVYREAGRGPQYSLAAWESALPLVENTLDREGLDFLHRKWEERFQMELADRVLSGTTSEGYRFEGTPRILTAPSADLVNLFSRGILENSVRMYTAVCWNLSRLCYEERRYREAIQYLNRILTLYPPHYHHLKGVPLETDRFRDRILDICRISILLTGQAPILATEAIRLSSETPSHAMNYAQFPEPGRSVHFGIPYGFRMESAEDPLSFGSVAPGTESVEAKDVFYISSGGNQWFESLSISAEGRGGAWLEVSPFPPEGISPPGSERGGRRFVFSSDTWGTEAGTVPLPPGVSMARIEVGVPPRSIRTGTWPAIVSWEVRARFREPIPLGSLLVTSNPPDAPVLLDGVERGRTPVRIDAVFPGPHSVRVEEPRFRFQERQVEIHAGQLAEMDFILETIRDSQQLALNRRLSGRWGSEEVLAPAERFGRGTLFSAALFPGDLIRVVWSVEGDLWMGERWNGWRPARPLPAPINTDKREHSPILSPLGRDAVFLAWLVTGDRRVDRRYYSISPNTIQWASPEVAEGFLPPYRTVYAGGQAAKEGPALATLPDGRILMLGNLTERQVSGTGPVGSISCRISEDGRTWRAVDSIEFPIDQQPGGFPLTFGPYCFSLGSRVLVTFRSHADHRTGIHVIPGFSDMTFPPARTLMDSRSFALYDLTETRPLVLRDGRMLVYWREGGNSMASEPMKRLDRIEYSISRDGENWQPAEKPLLLFSGQIGALTLFETGRGEGVFVYEEDGFLKALSCPDLNVALRN